MPLRFRFTASATDGLWLNRRGFFASVAAGAAALLLPKVGTAEVPLDWIPDLEDDTDAVCIQIQWVRAVREPDSRFAFYEVRWRPHWNGAWRTTRHTVTAEQPIVWLTDQHGFQFTSLFSGGQSWFIDDFAAGLASGWVKPCPNLSWR
jgi:hypothetical protein